VEVYIEGTPDPITARREALEQMLGKDVMHHFVYSAIECMSRKTHVHYELTDDGLQFIEENG